MCIRDSGKRSLESVDDATIAIGAIASSPNNRLGQDANRILPMAGDANGLFVVADEKVITGDLKLNLAAIDDGQISVNVARKAVDMLLVGVDGAGSDERGEFAASASHSNYVAVHGAIALMSENVAALLSKENSQVANNIVFVNNSGTVDLSKSAAIDNIY